MAEESNKKVIGIDELCSILDIGKNTAYELLNEGEIDAFKVGSNWKIVKTAVDEYIKRKVKEQKMKPIIKHVRKRRRYRDEY